MSKGKKNLCLAIIVNHMIDVPLKEDKTMCKAQTKMFDFWHCMCAVCGKGKRKKENQRERETLKEGWRAPKGQVHGGLFVHTRTIRNTLDNFRK